MKNKENEIKKAIYPTVVLLSSFLASHFSSFGNPIEHLQRTRKQRKFLIA
ncbi:MAG: hypothetical protein SGI96_21080 [Bacteroidota bacterium]|nr:hypothetical protein [Bacteroidota bacterium]